MSALLVVGLLLAAVAAGGYFVARNNPEIVAKADEVVADVEETAGDTATLVEAVAEEAVEKVTKRRTRKAAATPTTDA